MTIEVHNREEQDALKVSSPQPTDAGTTDNLRLCKVCWSIHEVNEDGACSKGQSRNTK